MRKVRKLYRWAAVIVFALLLPAGSYSWWLKSNRSYAGFEMTSERAVFVRAGEYTKGSITGIQPYMVPADYRTADALYKKLSRYLTIAKKNGSFTPATVVVFPEHTGTWLVALHEKASVYSADTSEDALQTVAASHPASFLYYYLKSSAGDKAAEAVFKLKAKQMALAYQEVFGRLAREYQATVVAGSIVLPAPNLMNGQLLPSEGPLYNVSAVFAPDGTIQAPLVLKSHPTREEQEFCVAGPEADLPVFETAAGRLGVLICADSWYPRGYNILRNKGAEVLAVPSYLPGNEIWSSPWAGYNGSSTPEDVLSTDTGSLTEGQAWQKYALAGRAPVAGFRTGINVFLRGELWELGAKGHPTIVSGGTAELIEVPAEGAAIINLRF